MGPFFAALGALLGLNLGHHLDASLLAFLVLTAVLLGLWSFRRGYARWYFIALALSLSLSLLYSYLPEPLGSSAVTGIVWRRSDNYFIVRTFFRSYYVSESGHSHEVGDILRIAGKKIAFVATTYESRFDFGAYLKDLGARYEFSSAKVETLWSTPFRLRSYELRFLSSYEGDSRALLDSLMFGKKDYSSSVISLADQLDLLFVLSASGLFYSGFLRLFEKVIGYALPDIAEGLALLLGLFFLPFSLGKIGILRVYLVRLLKFGGQLFFKKKVDHLTLLGVSALSMLLVDFHLAFQSGFLAGYGIATLLYFSGNAIKAKNKWVTKFRGAGLLRAFLIPLGLSMGGAIHILGLVFMIVTLPLSVLTLALGYFSFATFPIPSLIDPIVSAIKAMLTGFNAIDLALPLPALWTGTVFLFYGVLVLSTLLAEVHAYIPSKILILVSVGLYATSLLPIVPLCSQSVSFINVGQGDCCLVQDGDKTVMIDTGGVIGFDIATESLIPYLRKRRIYHIDALIASHQDYDHVGGVDSLRAHYDVREYVTEHSYFPLTIGDLTFFNYNDYGLSGENDRSLVLSLEFMDKTWLFTGDAPIEVERRIVQDYPDLDCDVLKVGHHGSDTSTCAEFLDSITPSVAIISCGAKNKYGHPTKEVLERLQGRGIQVRRTDLEGTIVYSRLHLRH